MKRPPVTTVPGSRSRGREIVACAAHRELIQRHAVVTDLIARTQGEIAQGERTATGSDAATARRLLLELANKRRFLAMLEDRMVVIASDLSDHEREDAQILEALRNPKPA